MPMLAHPVLSFTRYIFQASFRTCWSRGLVTPIRTGKSMSRQLELLHIVRDLNALERSSSDILFRFI